jgi:hypothetical protein
MNSPRRTPAVWFAMALLWLVAANGAQAQRIDTIREVYARLYSCWRSPRANPMDITVIVSFNREGAILGQPKITYESADAGEDDRLAYRIAVMETLQRCTPLPFTEGLGGAVAGRPFAVTFRTRQRPLKPEEKRAWLLPKIL